MERLEDMIEQRSRGVGIVQQRDLVTASVAAHTMSVVELQRFRMTSEIHGTRVGYLQTRLYLRS